MIASELTSIDWIIFFSFLFLNLLVLLYAHKKSQNDSFLDYILVGRKLTLPLFIGTLVGTWYGGIFGVAEIAYSHGIYNFISQGVFWYITYIIFALFVIPHLKTNQYISIPDYLEQNIGPRSAKVGAWFNLMNIIPIAYAISMAHFCQMIWGGNYYLYLSISVFIISIYSSFGGFKAVVYTDFFQSFIMFTSVIMVCFFSFYQFGTPAILYKQLPSKYFSLTGGNSYSELFLWGFIALSTLVDPNFYQRCFAAKDMQTAKKGILISTCIWIVFDISLTLGAMYAKLRMPELESQTAYFFYAIDLLPTGLKGFFLAGILATILSTLDSYLFLANTTLTYDLQKKKMKKDYISNSILLAFITIIVSFYFNGSVKNVWKTLGSISAGALLFPVMLTLISKERIKDNDFFRSTIMSACVIIIWELLTRFSIINSQIDSLYLGTLCNIVLLSKYFIKTTTKKC